MTNSTTDSDHFILQQYQQHGDIAVLGRLYQHYMHLVYGVALKYFKNKEEAQDAVHNIFEELVVKLPGHEVDNFKSWLYVLTRNHCLMQLRRQKTKGQSSELSEAVMESSEDLHHDDETRLEENLVKLESCIDKLKEEQQTCVRLFFLERKCYQEVELKTGFGIKKVKSYIQNGKRHLKLCMEESE